MKGDLFPPRMTLSTLRIDGALSPVLTTSRAVKGGPDNRGRICQIAVGMPIAKHPPHRTGRAAFPHPAPTLDE